MTEVTPIDDIAALANEAEAEIAKERREAAKTKITASLRKIADAKRILANLELQHKALLDDIREGV
jgi:hypothetical protein